MKPCGLHWKECKNLGICELKGWEAPFWVKQELALHCPFLGKVMTVDEIENFTKRTDREEHL